MDALPEIAWAILLMLVGCVLVVLEVFIPSGGIISILAAVSFIASIFIAFQPSPTTGPTTGLIFTATTVLAVPTLIALAFKYWPKTPMGKAFLGELPTEEEVLPEDPRRALLGRVGVARSKMLPSGAVEIDGQMIDAVTQGQADRAGHVRRRVRGARQSRGRSAGGQGSAAEPSESERRACRARSKSWGSIRWKTRWREVCLINFSERRRTTHDQWLDSALFQLTIPVNSYESGNSSTACRRPVKLEKLGHNRLQVTLSHVDSVLAIGNADNTTSRRGRKSCSIRPSSARRLMLAQGGRPVSRQCAVAGAIGRRADYRAWRSLRSSPATSGCGFNRSRPAPASAFSTCCG